MGSATTKAARLDRQLKKTANPCGCKSGAALSLAALVVWPAWIITSAMPREPLDWAVAILAYVPVVVVAGIIGKVAGIAVGRWRHRYLRRKLAERAPLSLATTGD